MEIINTIAAEFGSQYQRIVRRLSLQQNINLPLLCDTPDEIHVITPSPERTT